MKKKILLIIVTFMFSTLLFSQKIKLLEGNCSFFKEENVMGIEFTYKNLKVGKMAEKDYVKKHKLEADSKEKGSGDKWEASWINDRANRYEPKFETLFNKYAAEANVSVDNTKTDTKYKMIVNTYFIEPGFNVGIHSKPARVSMTIVFAETANPKKVMAKFDVVLARGTPYFDAGARISESYAKAAKSFGTFLQKYKK
ncbi:MAG: hypothetical protein A2X12_03010 [Bacteroidetes bacterium GWE2_29_8]|nr:MAG: hypothetical protein A2X12_03010 [Bacteroidetes bacterium GWE2_29_8]OFY19267.1 MAG: hypothetical protein A2X02_02080 [Bacteroidetes bacterium GWF2_29_10]